MALEHTSKCRYCGFRIADFGLPSLVNSQSTCRGLTFVELLIAATMFSILFVGLSGHLQGGVAVWHRATAMVEALQRQRVAWDRVERDLANAVGNFSIGTDEAVSAQFQADHLQWWTIVPSGNGQLGVRLVTYECTQRQGGQGLWRMVRTVSDAHVRNDPTTTLLLPGCDRLSVSYAYLPATPTGLLEWQSTWDSKSELPRLMAVSFHFTSGRDVQRLVTIPSGVLIQMPTPPPQ